MRKKRRKVANNLQSGGSCVRSFVPFNPIDFSEHDILKRICSGWSRVIWIPFSAFSIPVFTQCCS